MDSSIGLLNEEARLEALKRYEILDTPRDGSFDRLTRLASHILNVPIVIVSVVDQDRIWFKSTYGLDVQQIDREPGLCASAILSDELYVVENASVDPRTLANPLVASEFGLKFYAALPLKTFDGFNMGTFCIIDKQPRQLNDTEISMLRDLRDTVMDLLELRLSAKTSITQQKDLLNMAVHDLKTPLTNISARAELILRKIEDQRTVSLLAKQIKDASAKITGNINDLLIRSGREAATQRFNPETLDLAAIIEQLVLDSMPIAMHKEQQIKVNILNKPHVIGDKTQLTEAIENLLNNAVKYSYRKGIIQVSLNQTDQKAIIKISDHGPGFTQEDRKQLFQRFARLSAKPTGNEHSSGLGLSIVKQLIKQNGGNVWAEKQNSEVKGATMIIELPAV